MTVVASLVLFALAASASTALSPGFTTRYLTIFLSILIELMVS